MMNVENVMEMDMTYVTTTKMVLIIMMNGVMEHIIFI